MKKLYLFFAALLACSAIASAEDIELILKVTGADRIDAVVGSYLNYGETFDPESMERITLVDGENKISRPEAQTLYINPKNEDDIFKILDKYGSTGAFRGFISDWYEVRFTKSYAADCPYVITCFDEASYRDKNVTITMDDASKVRITRVGDAKVFLPEDKTITVDYNSTNESILRIEPRESSYTLYNVKVDGTDAVKKNGYNYFAIDLVDKSGDEPVYVKNIEVTANFPENLKFKTTITVDGPKEIISYIQINDEKVDNIEDYLGEEGFEEAPNTDIYIGIDDNYKLDQIDDNGTVKTYVYQNYPIKNLDCDHNITIKGREFAKYDVKFNVTGAEGFIFEIEDVKTELNEGENNIKITEGKNNCRISQVETGGWELVSVKDQTGKEYVDEDDWYWSYYKEISFYAEDGDEYTIIAKKPEAKTVTITMDDCSLVSIGVDGEVIKPEQNTIEVSYNDKPGARLSIQPRSYDGGIYKVTADGVDVERSSTWFYVTLVDNSGDEAVYIKNINVTAKFPEDLKYKTTVSLEGPQEMIKYIKLDDVEVDNIADYLTEDGFETAPLTKIAIGINDKLYDITELSDNGERKYSYAQLTIDGIVCDHQVVIKGQTLPTFDVKLNVTGAEGIYCEFRGNEIELNEGENIIKATKKDYTFICKAKPEWEITTMTDSNDKDYTEDYWWKRDGELDVKEGIEFTVVATKIERNNQIVVYFGDIDLKSLDYFTCEFLNYKAPTEKVTNGYNVINFRDEDGKFSVYASAYYDQYSEFIAYKNGELMPASYDGAKYREDEDVAHNDVYKFFFDNDPGEHTVTFDLDENVLDGYEVKKDIIADADASAPVKAVGPTRFTITPVSRAAEGFTIKIGETEILPEDGVYTFETKEDTTVEIKAKKEPTTGIDSILTDADETADVYNLQGIRVARSAKAADVKALPAGLYIVKGYKVIVK